MFSYLTLIKNRILKHTYKHAITSLLSAFGPKSHSPAYIYTINIRLFYLLYPLCRPKTPLQGFDHSTFSLPNQLSRQKNTPARLLSFDFLSANPVIPPKQHLCKASIIQSDNNHIHILQTDRGSQASPILLMLVNSFLLLIPRLRPPHWLRYVRKRRSQRWHFRQGGCRRGFLR